MEFFWVLEALSAVRNRPSKWQWSRLMKLSYDAKISWNNIFSVSSHWISLTIHFNLQEERCRPHFSKYCKSYFLTTPINGFTYIMSELRHGCFWNYVCKIIYWCLLAFHHTAPQNIFGNTGGRVLISVVTCCGNFTFQLIN